MDLSKINDFTPVEFGLQPHQINMIRRVFERFPQIQEVWIYGSRSRGDFGRASDIDLCLKDPVDFGTYSQIFGQLDELFIPFKFDLVRFDELENEKLKENIRREGQVFYQQG